MRARDEAFYAVDSTQWGKYTASDFTTVQQNGQFMSRTERLGNLQTQKQRPYVPRGREQCEHLGDLVVTRFFSGGLWVVEVWRRRGCMGERHVSSHHGDSGHAVTRRSRIVGGSSRAHFTR
jgi:hypothetical protein